MDRDRIELRQEQGQPLRDAIIRPARLDDAEALRNHCYSSFRFDDVRDYLAWCLRQADKGWIVRLVAEVGGQAVGNAQLTQWGQSGEIGSLVVAPDYRRRGLARRLLAALIDEADRRGLEALEISASEGQPFIVALYQRLGFERVEETEELRTLDADKKSGLFHPARPDHTVRLRMQPVVGRVKKSPARDRTTVVMSDASNDVGPRSDNVQRRICDGGR
jgi:ribosomal protein S18 acetylase RimI-like enzyme